MTNITDKCKQEAYKEANLLRKHLRTDLLNILKEYHDKHKQRYYCDKKYYGILNKISIWDVLFQSSNNVQIVRDLLLKVAKPYSKHNYLYVKPRGYFNFRSYGRFKGQPQEYSALEYYLLNTYMVNHARMWRYILGLEYIELKDL